jgi:hypothetical protein
MAMRLASNWTSSRAERAPKDDRAELRYGDPESLDAQIDDLLSNLESGNGAVEFGPGPAYRPRPRKLRSMRRFGAWLRRVWRWRRTTFTLVAALVVSTAIAVATVYLASQLLVR